MLIHQFFFFLNTNKQKYPFAIGCINFSNFFKKENCSGLVLLCFLSATLNCLFSLFGFWFFVYSRVGLPSFLPLLATTFPFGLPLVLDQWCFLFYAALSLFPLWLQPCRGLPPCFCHCFFSLPLGYGLSVWMCLPFWSQWASGIRN